MSSSTESSPAAARRVQKRPRPVISCLECRRKKLKCDRLLPCRQCIKYGREKLCEYAPGQQPESRIENEAAERDSDHHLMSAGRQGEIDDLYERVKTLEQALQHGQQQQQQQQHQNSHENHHIASTERVCYTKQSSGSRDLVRFHTDITLSYFPAANTFLSKWADAVDHEELCDLAYDLSIIHSQVQPEPPRPYAGPSELKPLLAAMRSLLPEQRLVDDLVNIYFDFFESCTRVLHKPTFLAKLQDLRQSRLLRFENDCFAATLLAVVSVASSLHIDDEHALPRLHDRQSGLDAYRLLQQWLRLQENTNMRTLQYLQVQLLLLKPHKSRPNNAIKHWEDANSAVQTALLLGLHDEQQYPPDIFEAEIRRRLWATVIENDLFFSVACNMPPRIRASHVSNPLSLDDVELFPGMQVAPRCRHTTRWTNSICQHVLSQSYSARAGAYAAVSDGSVLDYDSLLGWTRSIEWKINDAPQLFRLDATTDEEAGSPARVIAQMEFDFLQRRPLKAIYGPYARFMPEDDRFEEARIHWVQSAILSLNFQDLFDPKYPTLDLPRAQGLWDHFYANYGWDVDLAAFATCLELQRLRALFPSGPDLATPTFQSPNFRSPSQIKGWSMEGLMKSMEETLEPLVRRIASDGHVLRDVVLWTMITGSLRVNPTCHRELSMKNELQSLIVILKQKFGHKAVRRNSGAANDSVENSLDLGSHLKWVANFLRQNRSSEPLLDPMRSDSDRPQHNRSSFGLR